MVTRCCKNRHIRRLLAAPRMDDNENQLTTNGSNSTAGSTLKGEQKTLNKTAQSRSATNVPNVRGNRSVRTRQVHPQQNGTHIDEKQNPKTPK